MSQLAACANSAADSSIRLVQEISRRTTPSHAESDQAQAKGANQLSPGGTTPAHEMGGEITITTSLEVASASPSSTESKNVASRDPTTQVGAPNAPVLLPKQTIRMSKSAAPLKTTDPQPLRMASFDPTHQCRADPSTGMVDATNVTHGTAHLSSQSRIKLPEFRQSRRWAKFQAAQAKTDKQQSTDPVQPSTMRESSFEQQRARPKTSVQSPRPVPRSATEARSETDSIILVDGLCRSLAVPTWQVIRRARIPRPHSVPAKWVARKLSIGRHCRTTSQQSENKGTVDLTSSPHMAQLRRRLRPRKAVVDLRRKAGVALSTTKLVDPETVVDLNTVATDFPPGKQSDSPVPSLHDPEKAKRFSQECEALLRNLDFDKDWLASGDEPLPTPKPSSGAAQTHKHLGPTSSYNVPITPINNEYGISQPHSAPTTSMEASRIPASLDGVAAPEPPERTSSKGGPGLASLLHMTRPACIPVLHGFAGGTLVGLTDGGDSSSTIKPKQPKDLVTPTRQSSAMYRHPHRGPRPVASTDTLTMIEAQVHESAHAAIAEKLKEKTAFIVGSRKGSNTATSTPPERPLPSLPPPAIEVGRESSLPAPSSRAGPHRHVLTGEKSGVSDQGVNRKLQHIAAEKGLILDAVDSQKSAAQVSPTFPTPSSMYSQGSMESQASIGLSIPFTRHDIARLRPDRTRRLKKLIQDDLARERRISEEEEAPSVSLFYAGRPLPPVPSMEHRGSADPLDQFPSVPSSRPQSRASVGAKRASSHSQNRSRSHARHSSKASSVRPRRANKTLGTSEIKVLVDTRPAVDGFHARALSPNPVTVDNSQEGNPVKPCRDLPTACSPLHDKHNQPNHSKVVSTKKPSLRSLRSQASSRHSYSIAKPPRRGSAEQITDSDDETIPQLSSVRINSASVKKLHRRWNSNDIQEVQRLQEDLAHNHDIIMRLEQELRLQRDEILKTVRVFAPISHANGLKSAKYNAQQPVFVANRNRKKAEGLLSKEVESINAARTKTLKHKKPKEASGKLRPVSYISSASVTTDLTMGSTGSEERVSMEGSMTDPHEYDMSNSVSAQVGRKWETKHKSSSTRPGSQGSLRALHQPPPVAKILPKGKLAEEAGPRKLVIQDGDERVKGKENRLSVNHGFTDTEQMDRAIEAFQSFA